MNRPADRLIRGIAGASDGVRVVAALTTGAAREAALRHHCDGGAAIALGRTCTAALLLATLTKGGEQVTVQVLGKGPLGSVTADATDGGDVRGYVTHAAVAAPPGSGRARLAPLVGPGIVSVLRDLGLKEPYRGALELESGEIDEDLERYLTVSEQVVSALRCDVVVAGGSVAAAGGILVQCLPGGDVATVAEARERLQNGQLHDVLAAGIDDPATLAERLLGARPAVLDVREVRFRCRCSRERVAAALALVGAQELEAMRRDDGGAEVTCNFCGTRYAVDADELTRMIQSLPQA